MITITVLLAWAQQQAGGSGFSWSGDDVRTLLMGSLVPLVAYVAKNIKALLKCVRDLTIELKGVDGKGGALYELQELRKDTDWLIRRRLDEDAEIRERRRLKQEALDAAERDQYGGPERRHDVRRDRDRLADTYQTDEHPTEG